MDIDQIKTEEAVRLGNLALKAVAEGRLGRTEREVQQLQGAFVLYRKLSEFMANKGTMFVITWVLPAITIPLSAFYFYQANRVYSALGLTDGVASSIEFGTILAFTAFTKVALNILKCSLAKKSRDYLLVIETIQEKKSA